MASRHKPVILYSCALPRDIGPFGTKSLRVFWKALVEYLLKWVYLGGRHSAPQSAWYANSTTQKLRYELVGRRFVIIFEIRRAGQEETSVVAFRRMLSRDTRPIKTWHTRQTEISRFCSVRLFWRNASVRQYSS